MSMPTLSQPIDPTRRALIAAAAAASAAAALPAAAAAPAAPPASARAGRGQGAAAGHGRAALVTGSSRGIGAATARRLARDGYAVTVNGSRDRASVDAVVGQIERDGGRAQAVLADVADPAAVRSLFDAHHAAFGRLDVVVSNAGIMRLAPLSDMSDEDFARMSDVNFKGGFLVMREAARRVGDGGRIIALSSSITQLRSPTYGPYAATKAAQELMASSLSKELQGRGICVNAIAPGVVDTPLFTEGKSAQEIAAFVARTPHRRLGRPEDIADAIAALCSDDGAWINGQVVFANGGIV